MDKIKPIAHSYWDTRKWGKRGREMAPATLSILIQRARQKDTITYGDLATELENQFEFSQVYRKTFYGSPTGLVGFVLLDLGKEWGFNLPPINCIVVNKQTKMPGTGANPLLQHYASFLGTTLNKTSRPYLVEKAQQETFAYGDRWIEVAEALDAKVLKVARPKRLKLPKLPKIPQGGFPESKEHKALKLWVRDNPKHFSSYGKFTPGTNEWQLSSGDRLDVYFKNEKQSLAVEVKPSHASPSELQRGLFQVVKYMAVLQAEQLVDPKRPNAAAVLVTTNHLDAKTQAYAKRLNVKHIRVPKCAEKPIKW